MTFFANERQPEMETARPKKQTAPRPQTSRSYIRILINCRVHLPLTDHHRRAQTALVAVFSDKKTPCYVCCTDRTTHTEPEMSYGRRSAWPDCAMLGPMLEAVQGGETAMLFALTNKCESVSGLAKKTANHRQHTQHTSRTSSRGGPDPSKPRRPAAQRGSFWWHPKLISHSCRLPGGQGRRGRDSGSLQAFAVGFLNRGKGYGRKPQSYR